MKNVMITGATGFTGFALARRLKEDGAKVTAFVRSSSKTQALTQLGIETQVVDLTDGNSVDQHMLAFDRVYHLAASYREEHSDDSVFTKVNVDGTKNLLDSALKSGVKRFIHCSTVGVQGAITEPPASEDYRDSPGDHYQQSKLEGEHVAQQYFSSDLPVTIVRPVGIYGPGDRRFLKLFKAIQSGMFLMIGTGKTLYHMTYIDDLVDGFLLAGESDNAVGEVFTIAGPNYTTIRELVDTIAEVQGRSKPRLRVPFAPVYASAWLCEKICKPLGVSPPLYRRRTEFFALDRAFSIDKARRLLGYDPKISLRQGLDMTYRGYKSLDLL